MGRKSAGGEKENGSGGEDQKMSTALEEGQEWMSVAKASRGQYYGGFNHQKSRMLRERSFGIKRVSSTNPKKGKGLDVQRKRVNRQPGKGLAKRSSYSKRG